MIRKNQIREKRYKNKLDEVEAAALDIGRMPPQAQDLEAAILGALLIDAGCHSMIFKLLPGPEVFYVEAHQKIYTAIHELYVDSKDIDTLTVFNKLKKNETIEEIGGSYYLTKLSMSVSSGAHAEYHCKIIIEKFFKRYAIEKASEIIRESFEEKSDINDILKKFDDIGRDVNTIIMRDSSMKTPAELNEQSEKSLKIREERAKSGKIVGITTGLVDINKRFNGWMPGLHVIAARPGMGKTAIMLHFILEAAKAGHKVVVYSLEMSGVSLQDRLILAIAGIDKDKFRAGYMSVTDWEKYREAKKQLEPLSYFIDDNPEVSPYYVRSHSRIMHERKKCDIIFIDYLQQMELKLEGNNTRDREIGAGTRYLKIISRDLDIPVIVLSQLNRGVENRPDKRPTLADLRESGNIEQDSDTVSFLHRPEYYGKVEDDKGNDTRGLMNFIIAKNREGAVGEEIIRYNKTLTKFYDWEGIHVPFDVKNDRYALNNAIETAKEIEDYSKFTIQSQLGMFPTGEAEFNTTINKDIPF